MIGPGRMRCVIEVRAGRRRARQTSRTRHRHYLRRHQEVCNHFLRRREEEKSREKTERAVAVNFLPRSRESGSGGSANHRKEPYVRKKLPQARGGEVHVKSKHVLNPINRSSAPYSLILGDILALCPASLRRGLMSIEQRRLYSKNESLAGTKST